MAKLFNIKRTKKINKDETGTQKSSRKPDCGTILIYILIAASVLTAGAAVIKSLFVDWPRDRKLQYSSQDGETDSYSGSVFLNTEDHIFTADLEITVHNDSEDPWYFITFRDYPSAYRELEGGNISEISAEINGKNTMITRNDDPTVFSVILEQQLNPGEDVVISMKVKSWIPTLDARYGCQSPTDGKTDFYLGNALPVLCPYENGDFQAYPYFSVGECFYSKIADYDITVSVPSDYTLIATGEATLVMDSQTGGSTGNEDGVQRMNGSSDEAGQSGSDRVVWQYQAAHVRDFCMVAGNDYQSQTRMIQGIRVTSYWHEGNEERGNQALNLACSSISSLSKRLGRYPYTQYSVVETDTAMTGMEYPEMIMYSDNQQGLDSIFHETAHQWFYNLVGNNSYTSAWIDESLAAYVSNPGLTGYTGVITRSYDQYENDSDYVESMYFEGASMYNRLEQNEGSDAMQAFLDDYLKTGSYREVTTQELVSMLVEHFPNSTDILKEYIDSKYFQ